MYYRLFFFLFTLGLTSLATAQKKQQSAQAWLIKPSFALQFPGGDMADRFGNSASIGLGVGYKFPGNWQLAVDGQWMFGNKVQNLQQLLKPVLTDRGRILNQTGNYADVSVVQRGTFGSLDVGKTLNLLSANANSGVSLEAGVGYLIHWIDISNSGNDAPQINDEYAKGYDHLSGGLMLKQSLGYTYLSTNRRVNFRFSFEIIEAFTENWRGYSYSTGQEINESRLDLLYGFRFQWILPIYKSETSEYFYD